MAVAWRLFGSPAADQRVKVAVPVSGISDLDSYVTDRIVNGHCDCVLFYNTFRWPWERIASLIAPRPLLMINSDADPIFPMEGNERVAARLERFYALYGAGRSVDAVVSIGGHAYRRDIRKSTYEFINGHLRGDWRPVLDSEEDLVEGSREDPQFPIPPKRLRVFSTDTEIPTDQRNTTIDGSFVPLATPVLPAAGDYAAWQSELRARLRRVAFGALPESIPAARFLDPRQRKIETEEGIVLSLDVLPRRDESETIRKVRVIVGLFEPEVRNALERSEDDIATDEIVYVLSPRGVGETRWTERNPPNYVRRSYPLLGQTIETRQVFDVVAAAELLARQHGEGEAKLWLEAEGNAAVLAIYAACWSDCVDGLRLVSPPLTHMSNEAPQFLNVLRVCDIPDVMGILAPRSLEVSGVESDRLHRVRALYDSARCRERLTIVEPSN